MYLFSMDVSGIELWSEDRLESELAAHTPKGWALLIQEPDSQGRWCVHFEDAEGARVWESAALERKKALLDAVGFLWGQQWVPKEGPWAVAQSRPTVESVTPHVRNQMDPEDLDPHQVSMVYETQSKPSDGD